MITLNMFFSDLAVSYSIDVVDLLEVQPENWTLSSVGKAESNFLRFRSSEVKAIAF